MLYRYKCREELISMVPGKSTDQMVKIIYLLFLMGGKIYDQITK